MIMMDLHTLSLRLDSLAVFRALLTDPVFACLLDYLKQPSVFRYAEFASRLYQANGGNLTQYVREVCENAETPYVKALGTGNPVPPPMHSALLQELKTMQAVAELTPGLLAQGMECSDFLPEFATEPLDLTAHYLHRIGHIGRYGYGIFAKHRMFYLLDSGAIVPVHHADPTRLADLVDYQRERQLVLQNTQALLEGKPAANILLTGDAGTGKSTTVKAVVNELWEQGLRIIEIKKDQLRLLPNLLDELAQNPLKFILFIDDLSFLKNDDHFSALKAVLEGSVSVKSANVVIYATSNRRHIVKESFSDREGDDVHRNDTLQELVSLSERFGLHITFSKPTKEIYLNIVHHLAQENGLPVTPELDLLAERFALERGNRSARLARQLIDKLLSGQ